MRRAGNSHLGRALVVVALALALCSGLGKSADAYVFFTVPNSAGGIGGVVAEQIFPTVLGLDYQFNVLNVDPTKAAANQFSVGVGNCAAAGCVLNAVVPPSNFALLPTVPFLNAESNFPFWSFTDTDNCGGVLANCTAYVASWGSLFVPNDLPFGFWTQFNLFSSQPPVAGGGVLDPPAETVFTLDFLNETVSLPGTQTFDPTTAECGGTNQPTCGLAGVMPDFSTADAAIAGETFAEFQVPEPPTLLVLASAFILAMAARRMAPGQCRSLRMMRR